ncbi:MAG: GspE/PulE family protein [bacterium]
MLNKEQIQDVLIDAGVITLPAFDLLIKESQENQKNIENLIIEKKIISQHALYEAAAKFFGVPFIDLKDQAIRKDILLSIPESIASTHGLVAFAGDNKEIKIATTDPEDLETFEFIKKKTGLFVIVHLTTPEGVQFGLKQYHKNLKAELDSLEASSSTPTELPGEDLKTLASDLPVVRIVDTLLEYAIFEDASDIHIEPEEKEVNVRYRTDGLMHHVMTLPKNVQAGILARIKVLANLKVDEHRLPQDGRFKISNKDYNVSFRVSIIPTYDGEKVVMRLLREKAQVLTLEQLGFHPTAFEIVKRNIEKPHGMLLVTGPTGSGKSTTLYTVLNILNKPDVNIVTIEDPIEYRMPLITQSQVNPKIGYTFASGLRSFLRQDPDIIMVGEIRDEETAEIAVHSAMTGHMVLSTLHTNDAINTLPRLSDMGVATFLVATTTNLIIAQRLVRKICPNCVQSYNLDAKTIEDLGNHFKMEKIIETMIREKAIIADKGLDKLLFYHGKGCKQCNNTGYKGRIGIYETLEITPLIQDMIMKKATEKEIKQAALDQKMLAMVEDGFIKAKNGVTTLEEIMRVTKE